MRDTSEEQQARYSLVYCAIASLPCHPTDHRAGVELRCAQGATPYILRRAVGPFSFFRGAFLGDSLVPQRVFSLAPS